MRRNFSKCRPVCGAARMGCACFLMLRCSCLFSPKKKYGCCSLKKDKIPRSPLIPPLCSLILPPFYLLVPTFLLTLLNHNILVFKLYFQNLKFIFSIFFLKKEPFSNLKLNIPFLKNIQVSTLSFKKYPDFPI